MASDAEPKAKKPFPQMRIVALVFAALTLLLVAWYFFAVRQNYAVLYSDLRTAEASTIVAELDKQGVRYRLRNNGAEILVPSSEADQVRLRLSGSDALPGGVEGFELFNESDMGLTDFAQKIRYQRALQGELARTIMTMQGVAEARVHISMPERTLFRGERHNAEAAVELVMRSEADETQARIEGVQRLVAASVPDLSVSDVVVLNGRGEVISPHAAATIASESSDPAAPSLDYVVGVVRATLPNRRFEVSIEQTPSELAGAEGEDGASAASASRVVALTTETALSAEEMEHVSNELRRAGVVDGVSGGTLSFRIGPPATTFEPPLARSAPASQSPPAQSPRQDNTWLLWTAALLTSLIGLGSLGWVWWRRPRLSFEEHARLAQRLQSSLASQGGGDA